MPPRPCEAQRGAGLEYYNIDFSLQTQLRLAGAALPQPLPQPSEQNIYYSFLCMIFIWFFFYLKLVDNVPHLGNSIIFPEPSCTNTCNRSQTYSGELSLEAIVIPSQKPVLFLMQNLLHS